MGKTAVAEGLARRMVAGDVPDELRSKRLLSLDLSSMQNLFLEVLKKINMRKYLGLSHQDILHFYILYKLFLL